MSPIRHATFLFAACSTCAVFACGGDGLLQGDDYSPDGALPIGTARHIEAGGCGGATCDGGAPDAPKPPEFDGSPEPSNTCETARDLGILSGDDGVQTLTTTGSCSEWLSVRATENSSGPLGAPMKVTLALQSIGENFDVYAYVDPNRDVRSCALPLMSSSAPGTAIDIVSLSWGEAAVANGSDDGRTLTIAILKKTGPCNPDAGTYRLSVEGNR